MQIEHCRPEVQSEKCRPEVEWVEGNPDQGHTCTSKSGLDALVWNRPDRWDSQRKNWKGGVVESCKAKGDKWGMEVDFGTLADEEGLVITGLDWGSDIEVLVIC